MPTSQLPSPPLPQGALPLTLDEVRLIARLLHEADLSEIEIETLGDASAAPEEAPVPRVRLQLRRGTEPSVVRRALASAPAAARPLAREADGAPGAAAAGEAGPSSWEVLSPTVGFFRALQPPLQAGDEVRAGQKAGAVEALKIPTDVLFARAGRISAVLTEAGSGVEYGQPLFLIQSSH